MIKVKWGNHKLGDDTVIFNMSSAEDCPSKKLNLCPLYNGQYDIKYKNGKQALCYAEKAERTYKDTRNARRCQQDYWRTTTAREITRDLIGRIKARRKETRYFRFNESGDFHDQSDIDKLSEISEGLRTIGVETYGYSARKDLDFGASKFYFKSSGFACQHSTRTSIIVRNESEVPPTTDKETWIVCSGSCRTCNICKISTKINVAFVQH